MRIYPIIFYSMLIFKISSGILTPYVLAMLNREGITVLKCLICKKAVAVIAIACRIANTSWYNKTYHNTEKTIGNMLRNRQTDGH